MTASEPLIPKHGGYRKLKSFQVARLIYDLTVRFCDRYIGKHSRTHDQMVQAARSGVQNIAEGSQASGTSKKTELKLTNVARGSLEELRLDYEDFLRQRGLPIWDRDDPRRQDLIDRRCTTADEVASWVKEQHDRGRSGQSGPHGQKRSTRPPNPRRPPSPNWPPTPHWCCWRFPAACSTASSQPRQQPLKPWAASPSAFTGYVPKTGLAPPVHPVHQVHPVHHHDRRR